MTNYTPGSAGSQENKNFAVAKIIIIAVWLAIHGIVLALSHNRFGPVNEHPLLWLIPVASLLYTGWLVIKTGSDVLSENNGYYIAGVVLAFFSAMALAYCPFC
jgi:uncharacterized membrane protein